MESSKKIVALIPVRSKSKGIPHKNIKPYKNIPLMAHSIKSALESNYISDVFISTDSIEYQKIALEYGARITPLRTDEISNDLSPDIDVFKHFIFTYPVNEKLPDIIVHLRATYPNRTLNTINNAIEMFIQNYNAYDSLRSVVELDKTPYKMYYVDNNTLIPYFKTHPNLIEPYNQARQHFEKTYLHNGYIDIVKTETILINNLLSGTNR